MLRTPHSPHCRPPLPPPPPPNHRTIGACGSQASLNPKAYSLPPPPPPTVPKIERQTLTPKPKPASLESLSRAAHGGRENTMGRGGADYDPTHAIGLGAYRVLAHVSAQGLGCLGKEGENHGIYVGE